MPRFLLIALERVLLGFFLFLTRVAPPAFVCWVAGGVAAAFFVLFPRKRVEAMQAISFSFPERSQEAVRTLCRKCLHHLAMTAVEFLYLAQFGRRQIQTMTSEVEGLDILKDAYARNRGVILISAHLGNWELLGAWLAAGGFPVVALEKEQKDDLINALVQRARKAMNIELVSKDLSDFRGVLRALRQGKVIGLIADQNAGVRGIPVDFLGRKALAFTGPALLAKASGAPVIPIFSIRLRPGVHKILIEPPVEMDWSGPADEAELRNTQKYTAAIEQAVRKYPEQWLWLHKRWKGADAFVAAQRPASDENALDGVMEP